MKLLTACVTPFLEDGSIDFLSLEKLLYFQEQTRNGIVLLGSTGESLSLSFQERIDLISFASSLSLDLPIVVGVPGFSLKEAEKWIQSCQEFPIDGFLITTPIYIKPGIYGQTKWFEHLLNLCQHPAILYNIPSRSGVLLHPNVVQSLAGHPRCFGVKDSGGDLTVSRSYAKIPGLTLFCGDDLLWPDMHACGAYGLISVLSNAWPEQARAIVNLPSLPQITIWQSTAKWVAQSVNPLAIKVLLTHKQLITSPTVRLPLAIEDFYDEGLTGISQQMMNWHTLCGTLS